MALTPCSESENRLLVRCFPPSLSAKDKEEFLRHFGAIDVSCMPKLSKLRHCAFATFPSTLEARKALVRLHQLRLLSNRLIAVYARPEHLAEEEKVLHSDSCDDSDDPDDDQNSNKSENVPADVSGSAAMVTEVEERVQPVSAFLPPALGTSETRPSQVMSHNVAYCYPPVSASVVANIAHTLACVPPFYTQVLHLMNRMNLPPPFGAVTPTPPIPSGNIRQVAETVCELSTSSDDSESELEDDLPTRGNEVATNKASRSTALRKPKPVKRRRFVGTNEGMAVKSSKSSSQHLEAEEVFEPVSQGKKSIDLSSLIESAVAAGQAVLESSGTAAADAVKQESGSLEADTRQDSAAAVGSGFGTFAPAPVIMVQDPGSESDDLKSALENTISRQELRDGRLSQHEMDELPAFRKYSPGDATCRLYVKNLTRQVTEDDLKYVFGRYVDRESSDHLERFNIQLMKEGRMRGQAFVTLANEEVAAKARRETNGYLLRSKPLVVLFARSARAKE